MYVNHNILASNPFFEAYTQSDVLGKFIFLALYALSICSWIVLLHKIWLTYQARKNAFRFYEAFQLQRLNPLSLDCENINKKKILNPFLDLYKVLKKQSLDVLAKNRHFSTLQSSPATPTPNGQNPTGYLNLSDIDFVASHLSTQMASQVKYLEKNLYILSTTVSLAPFLGLLGTVWGILTTFSELQAHQAGGGTHQMVLSGLSLALATTVLGLIDAIPALIGYNYLKNTIRDFAMDMEGFSNDILAAVELQYRKVDG
ncbi:MotA/TolQ/ExbB proton channel family protein [Candidatus Protochlamydia phocaeensis]|uniref:MotA/TolQ/ExbB proton channel family protein n=1 Tax=Candidatus Protochlamydia phocaeensis TaxID=1414722 RepID=UPI0008392C81|nr:MotA/TolQ/ExbB proton channel family protein [Candidatus Protochlamydia phocaeensis]